MNRYLMYGLACGVLAGCDDGGGRCTADAQVGTIVGPALGGVDVPARPASRRLLVVATSPQYQGASATLLDPVTLDVHQVALDGITGDTVCRSFGTTLALLNRSRTQGDNLTLYDLAATPPRFVAQLPLYLPQESPCITPYVNAHDLLALSARKAYVTRYEMASLAIVDLQAHRVTGTIDLSAFQGRAPLPRADALSLAGDEVWVTLQRLDDLFHPTQRGLVVRLDPATDRVIDADPAREGLQAIELRHPNPVGPLVPSPDGRERWVVTMGDYAATDDGAIEAIDVATHAVREVLAEADVHANIDSFAPLGGMRLLVKLSGAGGGSGNRLVEVDLATRAIVGEWLPSGTVWSQASPVVLPGPEGHVFVPDPGDQAQHLPAGIRVFDPAGHQLTPRPIDVGARPYDLLLIP